MREMKYSGVEWIGDIPKSWNMFPIKHAFTIGRGRVISKDDLVENGKYPVFSSQTENGGCFGYIDTYDYEGHSITWTTDGAKAGTVFHRSGKYNCTNVCGILQLREKYADDFTYNYLLYAISVVTANSRRYDINGFKIMSNEMARVVIAKPDIEEQEVIANFLDQKCGQVDNLIANVQSQIETLKAYKQSLITEVITKGLEPNVPTKESGVEWIGLINARYKVQPINTLFSIEKRILGREPELVLSITQRGIIPKDINSNEGQLADSYAHYQIVNIGDFAMNHMDLLTGGVGISEYEGVTSPDYRVFVIKNKEMNPRYFLYVFETYYRNKIFYAFGQGAANVGRWRLPAQNFKNLLIPVPPIKDQNEIAEYLDEKCSQIDKLIDIKQSKIEKLSEYKKSLIYEYVTGKKEVSVG